MQYMASNKTKSVYMDKDTLRSLRQFTFPQILSRQAEKLGSGKTAIREKAYGIWQAFDWKDYLRYTKLTCLGLISIGLERAENVGFILDNRPEWLFSELGTHSAGGIAVNFSTSSETKELIYGLNQIQSTYVFVQDKKQVDKLFEWKKDLPSVRRIVYIDPTGIGPYSDEPWLISFSQLLRLGNDKDSEDPELFYKELWEGKADDLALMIMTSGTAGLPKPVMINYENVTEMAGKWLETVPLGVGDNWMSHISAPCIMDHIWGLGVALAGGMTMNFPETVETASEDLKEIGPSFIIALPDFWEKLMAKIILKMKDAGFLKSWLYYRSRNVSRAVADLEDEGRPLNLKLKFLKWFYNYIVFQPLLNRIGYLKIVNAYTWGKHISPEVIKFFRIHNLNLRQGYGLVETAGIFQIQSRSNGKAGTVGKSLPGIKLKISEDSEILVKNNSNFLGYYKDAEATSHVFIDGWFHTGDIGYLNTEGQLVIIGRKNDVSHTESGEYFSTAAIEAQIKFSPYIKEAVVWAERQNYLTALINIDFQNTTAWAEKRKIHYTDYLELSSRPEVEKLIKEEIHEINNQLTDSLRIHKFILLYKQLDKDGEELTLNGKVRKVFISQEYRELIEAMYTDKKKVHIAFRLRNRRGHPVSIKTEVNIIEI